MKKQNRSLLAQARPKSSEPLRLEETLPLRDLILELKQDIAAVSRDIGLKSMERCMAQEIEQRRGDWGAQTHHRHGPQPGYVVFHGRKVSLPRPRLRQQHGGGSCPGKLPPLPTGRAEATGRRPQTAPPGVHAQRRRRAGRLSGRLWRDQVQRESALE